nr:ATP-binding cassette domain-containing protein [Elstera litoralis]
MPGLDAAACCAAGIGRTFQVVRSFDSMSVLENVTVGAYNRAKTTKAAKRLAMETLEWTGLAHRADRLAVKLTPLEKRRLEVARALATKPRLLLLDEPSQGIMPKLVEQRVAECLDVADRAYVLQTGRVALSGTSAEIAADDGVRRAYLGI